VQAGGEKSMLVTTPSRLAVVTALAPCCSKEYEPQLPDPTKLNRLYSSEHAPVKIKNGEKK